MKEWFADLSMTKKLAIGFGSVLLLTAALAVSGWLSLGDVTRRSSLLEQITSLNESLAELRVSRLQYMLDNGDATSAEAVDRTLAGFEQRLNKILPNFTRPESTALLRQQAEQIQLTRVSLQKMRAAYAAGYGGGIGQQAHRRYGPGGGAVLGR
jgi:methyl-accepting chemotaxis protein